MKRQIGVRNVRFLKNDNDGPEDTIKTYREGVSMSCSSRLAISPVSPR